MGNKMNSIDFDTFKFTTNLDDATLKELYQGFLEELLEEKEKLLTQFLNKEYDKLAKTVHNIKGVSSSYMATNVFSVSLKLDSLLKQGKTNEIEVLVNGLTNKIIEAAGDIVDHYRL